MSRLGKLPVPIPDGVKVTVSGGVVNVEGGKGKLSRKLPDGITVKTEEQEVKLQQGDEPRKMQVLVVGRSSESREQKALQGLIRSLASNMIVGVTEGFEKKLRIEGVGYSVKLSGKTVEVQAGFAHSVKYEVPNGVEVEVPSATEITVRGPDKQLVGEVAAEIRDIRPPEPYKGKGIRYVDEVVKRKAGKAFVATD